MSASYQAVLWNRQKKIYDRILLSFVLGYLLLFVAINLLLHPQITQETLLIRSFGTLSILLLHIILAIGPLTRISPIFLPLLYNRRHLGVTMFICAAIHGIFSIVQFHALGNIHPILSVFMSNTHYESLTKFPFQTFGFISLILLFLMATSSHDFWLNNLTPKVWKLLHMQVYLAYALLILHVLLGVIQYETSPVFVALLAFGVTAIVTLHLVASRQERIVDEPIHRHSEEGLVHVCHVDEIPNNRARIFPTDNERIAIFKYDGKLSAISNVCKHQNGPLGEGRIVDGCVTCPWHGYQYLPHNGSSPPPFKEKVATYRVKIINHEVWVDPKPYPEGTEVEPAYLDVT